MSITARDDSAATAFSTGSLATTINVQAGDLIAVYIGTLSDDHFCDGVTDDIGNSYTVRTAVIGVISISVVWAYVLSSIGTDAANTITATFSDADSDRKNIIATSWVIDGGDTVTFDGNASKSSGFESSPWETASTFSTTGTDQLAIATFQSQSAITYSNHEIPSGTGATVITDNGEGETVFYRILTGTLTNEEAEVDPSGSQRYACEVIGFKSEAGAGGAGTPISLNHRKIMKNLLTR